MIVIIGNIISFIGCSLMVYVGLIKEKKKILIVQCIQFAIQGVANFVLGGITGVWANVVSIIRNLVCSKWKFTVWLKMGFIALQLLLSAGSLMDGGIVAWLPIFAVAIFTWFIDLKDEVAFKVVMIICQSLWLAFDICIINYVSAAFDIFTMISTLVGIRMILKDRKAKKE